MARNLSVLGLPTLQPYTKGLFDNFSETNTTSVLEPPEEKDEAIDNYNYIINVYLDGFLVILGFICNPLIVAILQKDRKKTSNTIFLQTLAIFDTLFLIYVLLYDVIRSINVYTDAIPGFAVAKPYIVAFVLPCGWTAQTGTIWTVMVMAIDRYLVVSKPLKATIWCTPKNAKKVSAGLFLSAALFNIPRWFYYYNIAFVTAQSKSNSIFVSHLANVVTYWDVNLYRKIYHQSIAFILLFIIPLTVMITLNVLLVRIIKESVKTRREMTNNMQEYTEDKKKSSGSSLNLTRMLVILITIFVVCELPDFIASIIGALNTTINKKVYAYYGAPKEALLVLNSAINFVIYIIFYKKFRMNFLMLIGCGKSDSGESSTSTRMTKDGSSEAGSRNSVVTLKVT